MPAPTNVAEFLGYVRKSGVADAPRLAAFLARPHDDAPLPATPAALADQLVRASLLTHFQAGQLLKGKWRNMILSGKYTILEPLGAGGMGSVYLCAHKIMRRCVALKVLPAGQADDPSGLERFHREARAVAHLHHPNIAGAYDVDHDGKFHFLVMEYVDGASLHQLVQKHGPLDPTRAAHYVHQAALGLEHAHEHGLVHRDVKPANLIVDRAGTVKVLDLGLARFFYDKTDALTKKYESGAVLGTADYLAPEQAIDSHNADARADVYSLGVTFYYLLAGRSPYQDGTVAQKLLWHQMREPTPIRTARPETPAGLADVIAKMMAKEPAARYQTMGEVAEALAPWTREPIAPPAEDEMPSRAGAFRCAGLSDAALQPPKSSSPGPRSPAPAKPPSSRPRWAPAAPAAVQTAPSEDPSIIVTVSEGLSDTTPSLHPPGKRRAAAPAGPGVPPWVWWAAGGGAAAVLAAAAVALALLWPAPPKEVAGDPPPAPAVAIKDEPDGLHVNAPKYEAVIDADGCLSGLRVGGVEFLKTGLPLAGGKTKSSGAYFYSEQEGNRGLVPLRNIERPSAGVVVATGDKFSVRYDFAADAVTVTAQNNTDYTAPFFLVFDSAAVGEVVVGKDERLPVPVTMAPNAPIEDKWRTTTWVAGRARLKVSDQTEDATTHIWGPWTDFGCQVWESDATTYHHCKIVLEPSAGAEPEKPALTPGGVLVTRAGGARRVRTELYEAVVEEDGCLPSLKIDGVEVLRPGVDVSRGVYFLQDKVGTLRLPDVKQPAAGVVTAQGDRAAIRYEFAPEKMTWSVENKTDAPMPFYAVLDTSVTAVRNGKGEWAKTPTVGGSADPEDKRWETVTWFAGRAKFTMTGGTRVWGPWPDANRGYQVWEASLVPHEKRTVTVEMGLTDDAEAAKVGEVTGAKPAPAADLMLYAPLDYQVFQRRTKLQGPLTLSGRVRPAYDRLEVRLTGASLEGALPDRWQEVPLKTKPKTFEAALPAPAGGWYKVEVRALKDGQVVAEAAVAHVGVGEVFVGAGQSNSTNCGQEKIRQATGMVSTFGGTDWRPADDPQPGVHDGSAGGSYWPAFGDAMYERYKVPIGVASTGHSGSSVNDWQPDRADRGYLQWTEARMNQFGREGFRAVLWHQGESDADMKADEYARKMTTVIQESRKEAGWDVPWFVARVSYLNPGRPTSAGPRDGQKQLWDRGVALEGPDTDALTGDDRDEGGKGIHFSPKGLRAHGKMWADKVGVWLDKELAK
jgi:serine/threonine protein kinase